MTVELTSPVLGKSVGDEYTGEMETWLLSEGYARQTGYEGPGVSNTGPTAAYDVDNDPTLAANRAEGPYYPSTPDTSWTIANDATNLTKKKFPIGDPDLDPAGADNDAPSNVTLDPVSGPMAGGTTVTITGDDLAGVTSVTFGGNDGAALDTSGATNGPGGTITVDTPGGLTGAVDVVLVDPSGNATLTDGFTYN